MNEEIKEILEGIKVVIKHDGTLEFDTKELKILLNYITNLQSNWNSLREYVTLKEKPKVFGAKNGKTLELAIELAFDMVLDKMNELEGKNN